MNFNDDMEIILEYAHYWNWCPDLIEFQKIYNSFPNSFSVLTPFAYSYLEECIRSTTSDYGIEILDELKLYFNDSSSSDSGDNRNSVNHGYMHPINWSKESFEKLVHDIARISPYVKF